MRALAVLGVVWVGACSGPSFTPSDCDDAECAGASSGGSANGGASQGGTSNGEGGQETGGTDMGGSNGGGTDTGGRNNGGTDAGGTNSGGTDAGGSGGSGTSGTSGVAGTDPGGFPTTPVLDDFNQDAPELGADWDGATHLYQVDSGALHCPAEYCQATFFYERFGVAQEVFATLVSFSDYSPEINLVLKAQGELDCDLMEILYAPDTQEILLEACWDGSWRTLGKVAIRVEPGAQLGARVLAEGLVEIYRNGELVETIDASDYPFIDLEGYIGVNGIVRPGEAPNIWDDFGGGTF